AEGGEQRDPGDRGREDERELGQGEYEGAAGEAPAREQIGRRRAEGEHERVRDRACLQADEQGVGHDRVPELGGKPPRRGVDEEGDEREHEEGERDRGRRDEPRGEEASHGTPKPKRTSSRRPSGPTSSWRNPRAAPRCRVRFTIAAS